MQRARRIPGIRIGLVVVLVLGALGSLLPDQAHAVSNFQKAIVRLDRMVKSTPTGGTVCISPNQTTAIKSVVVTFPSVTSAFTLNTTLANWTVNTNADPDGIGVANGSLYWPSGANALTNVGTASAVDNTAKTVTFPLSTALTPTVGNMYCFNFSGTNTLTTGSTAAISLQGNVTSQDASAVTIDTSNIAFDVVDVTGTLSDDQVVISATVPPIFQFAISSTTDTIPATGNLDYTAVNESGGVTATIHTNAKQGWIMWAKDSNQGLKSASAGNYVIPSVAWAHSGANGVPTTITAGTEDYGLVVSATVTGTSTCTTTVAGEYAAGANQVGAFEPNFQQIGQCSGGTSDGDQLTLKERATIKSTTPAATDYTDTMTVVGAGSF